MMQWAILMTVKGLKFLVLGMLTLISQVVEPACTTVPCTYTVDATRVEVVLLANEDRVAAVEAAEAGAAIAAAHADRIAAALAATRESTHAGSALPAAPPDGPEAPAAVPPAERIQRLVPPVRVEMTFTPDLLHPPRRDPSL